MTATATLSARQVSAGAPIKVLARGFTTGDSTSENYDAGVGVKVGATAPTNVSEFAETFKIHTAGSTGSLSTGARYRGADIASQFYTIQQTRTIPIGGTVVAGRYLFSFLEGAAGAIQAVSAGYHII